MDSKLRKDLEYFVDTNKEFGYLRTISYASNYDYNRLIDKALDTYNYYIKQDVPPRESKIQSLYRATIFLVKYLEEQCKHDNLEGLI